MKFVVFGESKGSGVWLEVKIFGRRRMRVKKLAGGIKVTLQFTNVSEFDAFICFAND